MNARESARLAVREATMFWEKARIPTKQEHRCVDDLMNLYKKWRTLQKTSSRRTERQINSEKEFMNTLDDLFDIAHGNALTVMKNQEDITFLQRQREKCRTGCMAGVDAILAAREKRKSERMEQEQQRKHKHVETTQESGM